jgi:hypothetical protein
MTHTTHSTSSTDEVLPPSITVEQQLTSMNNILQNLSTRVAHQDSRVYTLDSQFKDS